MSDTIPATLNEKELFSQFLKLRIQHWTNYGAFTHDYTPECYLRDDGQYGSLSIFSNQFTDDLENSDSPENELEMLIDDLESYLDNMRQTLSDFRAIKSKCIVMPEEPDEADGVAYAAWERAANAAEENPKYHSLIDTTAEQDDVDFMGDGSSPAPLSEPEFIDMTEEDKASIKGAA